MADPIHILVTGGAGQVGLELQAVAWPDHIVIHAPTSTEMDVSNIASVRAAFAKIPFSAVINLGAYTAVDQAENEVVAAFAVNAMGPAVLAEVARQACASLIQVSTDYVFDGYKNGLYNEKDSVTPLGVYGASKLAGELAVCSGNPRTVVLRTSWVVSAHRANFLKTMLRLAMKQQIIRVVDDQHGCPTSARDIAETLKTIVLRLITDPNAPTGIYHFVNDGETTWAGLAREIFALSAAAGGPSATVENIVSADYPTSAHRPSNSRLSTVKLARDYAIKPRPWQAAVAEIIAELNAKRTLI